MTFLHTPRPTPEILSVRTAAQSAIFQVQAVDLRFANGTERTYERLSPARRQAVMVLPWVDDELWLIREYAVGSERYELGCVKGLMDAGETPVQAACRELQEEIGFAAHTFTPLRTLYVNPSHMFSPMHVFIAQNLYAAPLQGDEPEPLELVRVPLSQLNDLIDNPDFGDARTLAALMLLQRHIQAA